ncbi:MAG: transposase, partial [Planctomycetota bacterium]
KNEMDGDRLRVHSQYNSDGRLFIKFISLILYSEVARTVKEKKLFDTYTLKELFAELKKLKITQIQQHEPFLSEVSKKQRVIFDAFGIQEEALHSY